MARLRATKERLISMCNADVTDSLFPRGQREDAYKNITDEQFTVLMEMVNFFLVQYMSHMWVLLQLLVVLLASNKKSDCERWIREHLSELISLRRGGGNSILHDCLFISVGCFSKEPIRRLFIEEGKMNVNVENIQRDTPLHLLSSLVACFSYRQIKISEGSTRLVDLLIDNGAHMDSVNVDGEEASRYLSQTFPRWSFNFNLKCLAARAILKHGIRYEKIAPVLMIPFIESLKPGSR